MTGRHRRTGRVARAAAPAPAPWAIEMVDARTHAAHLVADDKVAAGRRANGHYVAVCGVEVVSASLTEPGRRSCLLCDSIPTQRARTSR